jgi:hypothetical protein
MKSKQASFDYQKYDKPQVSRAALQQGFGLTKQQWQDISTIVNKGLIGHWQLRSRAAKQTLKEVRHEILGAFPELSIRVPPQWIEKGAYQIIRAVRATWRRKHPKDAGNRPQAPKNTASASAATNAVINPAPATPPLIFNTQFISYNPQAQPATVDASAPQTAHAPTPSPAPFLAKKELMSHDMSNASHSKPSPLNQLVALNDASVTSPTPTFIHGQDSPRVLQGPVETPSLPALTSVAHITFQSNLKKFQLCAIVLGDRKDSSFVNLGELLIKSNRQQKAVSYCSLEDITDQDWAYYHGAYLQSDLDRGFQLGMDKIYFHSGEDMIRVKNASNWRAAMITMQEAGATQFKFYIEQGSQE